MSAKRSRKFGLAFVRQLRWDERHPIEHVERARANRAVDFSGHDARPPSWRRPARPNARNAIDTSTTTTSEPTAICQRLSSQCTIDEPPLQCRAHRAPRRLHRCRGVSNTPPFGNVMRRVMLPMRSEIFTSASGNDEGHDGAVHVHGAVGAELETWLRCPLRSARRSTRRGSNGLDPEVHVEEVADFLADRVDSYAGARGERREIAVGVDSRVFELVTQLPHLGPWVVQSRA